MTSDDLKNLIVNTLEDGKAVDVTPLDVRDLTSIADIFVICTATSTRHAKSLADKIIIAAKAHGVMPLNVEGELTAEWILVDLQDIIVHILLAEQREFYQLEKLWSTAEAMRKHSVL